MTGYELRKKFAIGSLIFAAPVLLFLLRNHSAGWLTSILILGALIPAFISTLSGYMLVVGPVLHQDIKSLQKIELGVSIGRLMMLVLMLVVFPWAYIGILSASLPLIWGNFQLRKISNSYVDWGQKTDPVIQKEILAVVKRILPGSIYYCFSGQITIWLISVFGTTSAVAQIGALGRISIILGLVSNIFGLLIIPRFARLSDNKNLLFKRFVQIQFGLIGLFLFIITIVSIFPSPILLILGKNYLGLEKELVLTVAGSCISLLAGLLFTLATSRNWAINPLISIPVTLCAIVCGVLLINISSLKGILKFNLFVSSIEVIMYLIYCILKINKYQFKLLNISKLRF